MGRLDLDVLGERADDVALGGVLAHEVLGGLFSSTSSDMKMLTRERRRERTPKLASKMPLQDCTAHPTWVELFQTT